ncbi:MAG: aminotransferase class I/II-fold pyridoxal phosphate-dependent enzyme [Oscillospiraceae bacterium]|nr:aminotransferase class I/II-fold pyridoxal phosphate-dependent enzyme [Oscillospiraceae bacterium]
MISSNLSNVRSDIRGEIYYKALELEKNGEKILKLNTGNPAAFGFKMPQSIKNAIVDNFDKSLGYCDLKGMPAARQAIYNYHLENGIKAISPDDVFITNGVSEAAYMAITAICGPGDEVLVPTPCYSLWVNMIRMCGGEAVFYDCREDNEWQPDVQCIEASITPKTKAILLINPNNPTGAVYTKEVVQSIYDIARKHNLIILSDEIYDRLVYPEATHIPTGSLGDDVLVMTFNGLSKSHCVCGLRCGWIMVSGPADKKQTLVTALVTIASVRLCSNAAMQLAIPAALADTEYTKEMLSPTGRLYLQRKVAIEEMNKIPGLEVMPNKAALYMFPKIDTAALGFKTDKEFAYDLLLKKKILIVPGSGFYAKDQNHFRIVCLPAPEQMGEAIRAIGDYLQGK